MDPKEVKVALEESAPFGPCHRTDSTRAGRCYDYGVLTSSSLLGQATTWRVNVWEHCGS